METSRYDDLRDRRYDCVVVGAGIGGLVAAAYLAARGFRSLVVENVWHAGGSVCSFRHKGYYFDGGPTSVGFLTILSRIYGDLGLWPQIQFTRVAHQVIAPDFGLDFTIESPADLIGGLSARYPESRGELERLFGHMQGIRRRINPIYDRNPGYLEGFRRRAAQLAMPLTMFPTVYAATKYSAITKKQTVERFLRQPNPVRDMFMATGYEDIATVDMSYMWDTFTGNLFYPTGGMTALIRPLVEYLGDHGTDILYRHRARRFHTEGRTVTGLELSTGDVVRAPHYISNADFKRTYLDLIGAEKLPPGLRARLDAAGTTEPILSLFLGLRIDTADLPVFRASDVMTFFGDTVPHQELDPADPDYYDKVNLTIYIPTLNDPSLNAPGRTSMNVQCVGNYHFRDRWQTGPDGRRGRAYRDLKRHVAEVLLRRLERIWPDCRRHIDYQSLGTPITYERYLGTWEGASCGWAGDREHAFFKNTIQAQMGPITPYENLMLAGQWTYLNGGIPAAMQSGRTTGVDTARKLEKARGAQRRRR